VRSAAGADEPVSAGKIRHSGVAAFRFLLLLDVQVR
jgi:hypothetical protein